MEITFEHLLSPEQVDELNLYIEASREYYIGDAIMSDVEFDELSDKLLSYGIGELTKFIETGIYRVGKGLDNSLDQTHGKQEMISLFKIKWKDKSSVSDINKFFIGVNKPLFKGPKFDGAALKISFDLINKEVTRVITRGGLDVTKMLKNMPNIKSAIKYNTPIVTGELLCPKKVFAEKYSVLNGGEYENARNFVGSLVKNLKVEQNILNDLVFVPLTDGINPINKSVWTPVTKQEFYSLEAAIEHLKSDEFPFLCDGIVIAFFEEGERRVKDNYPLNMVAVKFPGSRAKTKVIGFDWTQKKSGNLTPMILIKPVSIDGATMTKANGYNYQKLIDKHIGLGSEIEIEKSGDIIPVVARVITRSNNIVMPDVEYVRRGKHLVATNLEESIKYKFVLAMKTLNIDGIGDTLAEQIGSVVNYQIFDCFNEKFKPQICEMLGGGDRWQKFKDFYNIKTLYLDTVIHMLQFNQVGPVIAKKVALLMTKKSTDTSNIPDYVLRNVCRGEGFQKINEVVQYLKLHGVRVLPPVEITDDVITFEMSVDPGTQIIIDGVVLTKQDFVKKLKEKYPNSLHTALTKTTNYLFTNSLTSNTGKINKARKYNVDILTYQDALTKQL